ncbi:HPr family phosphocarrier protein [Bacillus sp. FJAT-49711]|uniref:HPr family phosphocarrier protein n=1 Tax=Bacillus sp. FJAT-49711 TaxID=2833585 RepID=UPI001BC9415A|nr:HPr family phosphocarrier protein [Bacillus sp. FJAT-49711]MBS4219022.1 HPr family phosphocarrier protein [Bacillus sp. FJAT-49711]
MKVIQSKTLTYKEPINLEKINEFFNKIKSYQFNLFLSKQGLLTNGKTLASLVSFFLILKQGDSFMLILEGKDANQALESFLDFF